MNFGANLRINKCGWLTLILIVFLIIYLRSDSPRPTAEDMVSIKTLLEAGIAAAESGGREVVAARASLTIDSKGKTAEGANDPVTSADLASNCAMQIVLAAATPRVLIVSEEGAGACAEPREQATRATRRSLGADVELLPDEFVHAADVTVWIDPLDATQEYTEKLDKYVTTMVCVAVRGVPIIGVVHYPFSQHTSWGWHTKRVSSDLQRHKTVGEGGGVSVPRVLVSRSHAGAAQETARKAFGADAKVIPAGGAGYKMLEVARGNADLYLHTSAIKKWDTCAGHAIITALGGNVTTLGGQPINYGRDSGALNTAGLLVTRSHHQQYLELLDKQNG